TSDTISPIEDPNVRNWIAISIGLALLLGVTAQGQSTKDSYPNRPVRIIVPFTAGGPGDIFARLIGQKLSEQLGQQFFVENRPGAGGNMGTAVAARAPADGYTLDGWKFSSVGQRQSLSAASLRSCERFRADHHRSDFARGACGPSIGACSKYAGTGHACARWTV